MPMPHDKCSHGRMYKDECPDCDIAWHKESIKQHQKGLERAEIELERARERKMKLLANE